MSEAFFCGWFERVFGGCINRLFRRNSGGAAVAFRSLPPGKILKIRLFFTMSEITCLIASPRIVALSRATRLLPWSPVYAAALRPVLPRMRFIASEFAARYLGAHSMTNDQ